MSYIASYKKNPLTLSLFLYILYVDTYTHTDCWLSVNQSRTLQPSSCAVLSDICCRLLPCVVSACPVGRTGRCPCSWFRATRGSPACPERHRAQREASFPCQSLGRPSAVLPSLRSNALHTLARTPPASNTWKESSLNKNPKKTSAVLEQHLCSMDRWNLILITWWGEEGESRGMTSLFALVSQNPFRCLMSTYWTTACPRETPFSCL